MASFIRTNILRRGGEDSSAEPSPNPEEPRQQQQSETNEQNQEDRARGSFPFSRRFMPALFTGRSNVPAATAVVGRREELARDDGNNDDEPKTPRLDDQTTAPSTRLHLSHITRTWRNRPDRNDDDASRRPPPPPSSRGSSSSSSSSYSRRTSVNTAQYPGLATPPAVAISVLRSDSSRISRIPSSSSSSGRRRFEGPDPAELHLAALADSGRRRRERHERRHGERRRQGRYDGDEYRRGRDRDRSDDADDDGEESHPRNFLFCCPWVHSRRLRHQILKCFVSGLFMVAMLSVCTCTTYLPPYCPIYAGQLDANKDKQT